MAGSGEGKRGGEGVARGKVDEVGFEEEWRRKGRIGRGGGGMRGVKRRRAEEGAVVKRDDEGGGGRGMDGRGRGTRLTAGEVEGVVEGDEQEPDEEESDVLEKRRSLGRGKGNWVDSTLVQESR